MATMLILSLSETRAPPLPSSFALPRNHYIRELKKPSPVTGLGDISFAIQEHTEKKYGYGVVRELVGHGLGRSLHEDPQVANYGKRGSGIKLREGLILAIEPMINLGKTGSIYRTRRMDCTDG